jgi:hypothetical protein
MPSGVHTGGAWELNGEIWKPLDGRPFANADCHLPTDELDCLETFAGMPLFPQNWRKETVNGRNFIVRQKGFLLPEDRPFDKHEALQIEMAIRYMNASGWELNDELVIAQDPTTYD